MANLISEAGLADEIGVDSAGTAGYHLGERADPRSREAASRRGIELPSLARRFETADFDRFELILAMDRQNLADVLRLAPDEDAAERVRLLREYDPESVAAGELDVPDPYYGDGDGFEHVLDIVERACRGLLEEVSIAVKRDQLVDIDPEREE